MKSAIAHWQFRMNIESGFKSRQRNNLFCCLFIGSMHEKDLLIGPVFIRKPNMSGPPPQKKEKKSVHNKITYANQIYQTHTIYIKEKT